MCLSSLFSDKYTASLSGWCCTCKPAFVVTILSVLYPHLVPGMGKVNEENKLDDNEDEGSHHSKVKPHWKVKRKSQSTKNSQSQLSVCSRWGWNALPFIVIQKSVLVPLWNVPSGMKKAPTVIPTRIRNLKNQNLENNEPTISTIDRWKRHIHTWALSHWDLLYISQTKHLPILNSCAWVLAATDTNHDGGEQKEEAGHGETHTVHRFVAHEDIAVGLVFNTRYSGSSLAKSWDL